MKWLKRLVLLTAGLADAALGQYHDDTNSAWCVWPATNYARLNPTNLYQHGDAWVNVATTASGSEYWVEAFYFQDTRETNSRRTNAWLNAQDLRNLDLINAVEERWRVIGDGYVQTNLPYLVGGGQYPQIWRRWVPNFQPPTMADYVKTFIRNYCGSYIDPTSDPSNGPPFSMLSETGLVAMLSLPTNYFRWTPERGFDGLGPPYYHVMTNAVTVAGSGTNILTNFVINSCGTTSTVTGTNGQVVTITCTNEYIAPGCTSYDYGLDRCRSSLALMVWTVAPEEAWTSVVRTANGDAATWASATSALVAAWATIATNTSSPWVYWEGQVNGEGYFTTARRSDSTYWTRKHTTNYASAVDLYLSVTNPGQFSDPPDTWIETLDLNGDFTNLTPAAMCYATWTNADASTWQRFGQATNLPSVCDEPPGPFPSTNFSRGYLVDRYWSIFRWDVTNGFRYR